MYDPEGYIKEGNNMTEKMNERHCAASHKRSRAGETLTETLIAMLIIGLSSVLFLTMVGTSGRIFRRARTAYNDAYDKTTAVAMEASSSSEGAPGDLGTITVAGEADADGSKSSVDVKVKWYGSKDYVLAYKME